MGRHPVLGFGATAGFPDHFSQFQMPQGRGWGALTPEAAFPAVTPNPSPATTQPSTGGWLSWFGLGGGGQAATQVRVSPTRGQLDAVAIELRRREAEAVQARGDAQGRAQHLEARVGGFVNQATTAQQGATAMLEDLQDVQAELGEVRRGSKRACR